MNINDRMDRAEAYRARQDRKQALTGVAVVSLIAGMLLNIIGVISAASSAGMSFYEYLHLSNFGLTVLMFENNPALLILSGALFFAGFIGIVLALR